MTATATRPRLARVRVVEPPGQPLTADAVRSACNRVKFAGASEKAQPRFGEAAGVWALRTGSRTTFMATDGAAMAVVDVDGVLPGSAERSFFPYAVLAGKAKGRPMPEALADARPLTDAVLSVLRRVQTEAGASLAFEAAELDEAVRMVGACKTVSVALTVAGDVLTFSGRDAVVTEFEVVAESMYGEGGRIGDVSVSPGLLLDGAKRLGDEPVWLVQLKGAGGLRMLVLRQGAYAYAVCERLPEKPAAPLADPKTA